VDVYFDPKRISFTTLTNEARKVKCADAIFTRSDEQHRAASKISGLTAERSDDASKPDKQPKYFMSKSLYRFVPMTESQAARVNAAIGLNRGAKKYLSPSQLRILNEVKAKPDAGWAVAIGAKDLTKTFAAAEALAEKIAQTVAR
jgi:hypothetical protein